MRCQSTGALCRVSAAAFVQLRTDPTRGSGPQARQAQAAPVTASVRERQQSRVLPAGRGAAPRGRPFLGRGSVPVVVQM